MQNQQPQQQQQLQTLLASGQISGSLSFNNNNNNSLLSKEDEEMSKSALSTFKAKEEEIEKKKLEVKEKVQAQLGRIEEETRRLAIIREIKICQFILIQNVATNLEISTAVKGRGNLGVTVKVNAMRPGHGFEQRKDSLLQKYKELEALADPMKKEVSMVRKRIDTVNKELKPLGQTCQKKEREYKEAQEAFNDKHKEKVQLISRLMEREDEDEEAGGAEQKYRNNSLKMEATL
ncbi:putative RAB6-interacting golgin-like isoform X2 [Capsicum annuum]|nr:putative RAB6-interacting golgin-like isoform X2 [Capsicum annuum]